MIIGIVNYGMGNLGSVEAAVARLGVESFISSDVVRLKDASAFILPGVGAFGKAMENLRRTGLDDFLGEHVLVKGKPLLGICLGMQLLATDSVEFGYNEGLGWIPGHIVPIPAGKGLPVPHVGWNQVEARQGEVLFDGIDQNSHYFFDHSFHYDCSEKEAVVATCDYGQPMVSALRKDHIFACQFHPEKSQRNGLKTLRNFFNYVVGR